MKDFKRITSNISSTKTVVSASFLAMVALKTVHRCDILSRKKSSRFSIALALMSFSGASARMRART